MSISNRFPALLLLTGVMFAVAPFMIANAPYESTMLLVQKIFYFHVPSWFAMFTGVFVAGIGGALYLSQDDARGDRLAASGSEIALMFGAMGLTSGPIWARKSWGVWWQWDAKLTIALLLELIFVAYLLLRKYGGAGSEKLAAAVALFGMAVAPFVWYAVNIWRTIHPTTNVVPSLKSAMAIPFWFCVATFLLFLVVLLALRVRVEHLRTDLDELYRAEES